MTLKKFVTIITELGLNLAAICVKIRSYPETRKHHWKITEYETKSGRNARN